MSDASSIQVRQLAISRLLIRMKSLSILPVNTAGLSHGGQVECLWWKGRGLELSTWHTIPPVNTVSHGGQTKSLWGKGRGLELNTGHTIPPVNTVPHGGQMESLWGKRRGLELNTGHTIPPVNTVPHGGQTESLWGKRRGLELSEEPSETNDRALERENQNQTQTRGYWTDTNKVCCLQQQNYLCCVFRYSKSLLSVSILYSMPIWLQERNIFRWSSIRWSFIRAVFHSGLHCSF